MKFKTLNQHYIERFGEKVYKLSIDAGFTCPNRDGTKGTSGCSFCSGGSSYFSAKGDDIAEQLERAKRLVKNKIKSGKYIAYFQSYSSTYAPASRLEKLYGEALKGEDIVGIAVATRPDCLSDEVIELLGSINEKKAVYVELGLQTSNEKTANDFGRGYENGVYADAVRRLKAKNIHVVTHIIIGLMGETAEDALNTTKYALSCGTDGVKFHLLHILRGTEYEKLYNEEKITPLTLEEYAKTLKLCLSSLGSDTVVHRITGDGAKAELVAPEWSADKKKVLNYLTKYLGE